MGHKRLLGGCVLLWGLTMGCGAAHKKEASPVAEADSDATHEAASPEEVVRQAASAPIVIEENPEVQVTWEAQERHRYAQLGVPAAVVDKVIATRVELHIPEGFSGVEPEANAVWQWDYTLRHESGQVEVRFAFIPASAISWPDVSEETGGLQGAMSRDLMTLLMRLNGATLVADMQPHPPAESRTRFNADYYVSATFEPAPAFASYPIGSVGAIYHPDAGEVIIVSLLSDMTSATTRTAWITGANAVRFAR